MANAKTDFITVKEAADRLGKTSAEVDDLIEAGELGVLFVRRLVRRDSVEAYAVVAAESS